jgi:hypothetical protein
MHHRHLFYLLFAVALERLVAIKLFVAMGITYCILAFFSGQRRAVEEFDRPDHPAARR